MSEVYKRQSGLIDPSLLGKTTVAIVGLGGLGSFATVALAKMGVGAFHLYDGDRVERHNIPNQMFFLNDLGIAKVTAIAEIAKAFGGGTYHCFEQVVTKDTIFFPRIILSCVDSMRSRKEVYEAAVMSHCRILIDTRSGGEMLRFIICPLEEKGGREAYEKTLYDDSKALELPCTERAIIYTGFIAGAVISALVKKEVKEEIKEFMDWSVFVPRFDVIKS